MIRSLAALVASMALGACFQVVDYPARDAVQSARRSPPPRPSRDDETGAGQQTGGRPMGVGAGRPGHEHHTAPPGDGPVAALPSVELEIDLAEMVREARRRRREERRIARRGGQPTPRPSARPQPTPRPPRPGPGPGPGPDEPGRSAFVQRVLRAGRNMLGRTRLNGYRADCVGYVRACYGSQDVELFPARPEGRNGVEMLFNGLREAGRLHRRRPQPGDLVFFDNTWDFNGNGRLDDPLTHVGIVEEIKDDGTVILLHLASNVVKRYAMNLQHPNEHLNPETGETWNDWMRRRRGNDPPGTPYTTGATFRSYGRPPLER